MATTTFQPEGNYYDKYNATNPISRYLMDGFLSSFDSLVQLTQARTAYEFGCGEGNLSLRLARLGIQVRGSDVSAKVVEQARENARKAAVPADFNVANIYEMSSEAAAAELIVCCEVLEHLEETGKALDLLVRSAHPWLLVSVPREPIWRALNVVRGAYWRDLGNTPGHVQHWSTSEFVDVLRSRVDVIQVRKPLPWTMVLCRVDGSK